MPLTQSKPGPNTRCGRILQRLHDAGGAEVPAPEIAKLGGLQWQTRVSLRKLGFRIPPPRSKRVKGELHTWYRLEPDSSPAESNNCRRGDPDLGISKDAPPKFPEFGDLRPERRHKDLG